MDFSTISKGLGGGAAADPMGGPMGGDKFADLGKEPGADLGGGDTSEIESKLKMASPDQLNQIKGILGIGGGAAGGLKTPSLGAPPMGGAPKPMGAGMPGLDGKPPSKDSNGPMFG